jgi:hypothetical protein
MKGAAAAILPAHIAGALLMALRAMPPRGAAGWPTIDEESWWLDVLHDPRGHWPTEKRLSATGRHAHLRLDRWRRPTMALTCQLCGIRKSFDTDAVNDNSARTTTSPGCGTPPTSWWLKSMIACPPS